MDEFDMQYDYPNFRAFFSRHRCDAVCLSVLCGNRLKLAILTPEQRRWYTLTVQLSAITITNEEEAIVMLNEWLYRKECFVNCGMIDECGVLMVDIFRPETPEDSCNQDLIDNDVATADPYDHLH